MDLEIGQQQAIDSDVDFWPLEHPMEPQDEDLPVKCPMSPSSSINRSEQPRTVNNGTATMTEPEPPVRAVRKRHHTLTSLPPLTQPQTLTVSQMLHQFHKV